MPLDTKYRPQTFEDVLGQDGTIKVLKNLLEEGRIFENSYVFAGPSGVGKTTTARILARAMLCDQVTDQQEPCNTCDSCQEILEHGKSHSFIEMDAANHSGKDSIQSILDDTQYYTFDGQDRKIYLIDECHRLSKSAMDALLKPMEDTIPGSDDRKLVCLFCTTEPEKLRDTIKTRCMMFSIKRPDKDSVVNRLSYICEEDGITYSEEALDLLVDECGSHIRDMINTVEKIGKVGDVTVTSVERQFGLSFYKSYLDILSYLLSGDASSAIESIESVLTQANAKSVHDGLIRVMTDVLRSKIGEERSQFDRYQHRLSVSKEDVPMAALTDVLDDVFFNRDRVHMTSDIVSHEVLSAYRHIHSNTFEGVQKEGVEGNASVGSGDQSSSQQEEDDVSFSADEHEDREADSLENSRKDWALEVAPFGGNHFLNDESKEKDESEGEDDRRSRSQSSSPPSREDPIEPADEDNLKSIFKD
jgi:DNA polymerase III subunit gamma/tau